MAKRVMYALVEAPDTEKLIQKVIEWLERGWRPQGGVSITPDGTFIQPVMQEIEIQDQ